MIVAYVTDENKGSEDSWKNYYGKTGNIWIHLKGFLNGQLHVKQKKCFALAYRAAAR